jgi:hypothetical protein
MTEAKHTSRLGILIRCWVEPELKRTTRLLRMANTQLDHALRENIRLADLSAKQAQDIVTLQSDNRELKAHIQRIEAGNTHQLDLIGRMERRLKEMEQKYEYMIGRVMQLQAERGLPIEVPKPPEP